MSIGAVSLVLRGAHGLDPTRKLILVVLAEHAHKATGEAWPSIETIARHVGIHRRGVTEHLGALRADGWIEAVSSTTGGRGASTHYQLNNAKLRQGLAAKPRRQQHGLAGGKDAAGSVVSTPETMASGATNHGAQHQETMVPAPPEPVLEPLKASVDLSAREDQPSQEGEIITATESRRFQIAELLKRNGVQANPSDRHLDALAGFTDDELRYAARRVAGREIDRLIPYLAQVAESIRQNGPTKREQSHDVARQLAGDTNGAGGSSDGFGAEHGVAEVAVRARLLETFHANVNWSLNETWTERVARGLGVWADVEAKTHHERVAVVGPALDQRVAAELEARAA